MGQPTWDEFVRYVERLRDQTKPGRQGVRVIRDSLRNLVEQRVLPRLTADVHSQLFPLGYDPEQSDLKIAAGVGIERGYITADEYETALRADARASLFGFLQPVSGKTLGETIAPLITEFWLEAEGDTFAKMKATDLYDIAWMPHEGGRIRIELKASTEEQPRFQQIRPPTHDRPLGPWLRVRRSRLFARLECWTRMVGCAGRRGASRHRKRRNPTSTWWTEGCFGYVLGADE